MSRIRSVVGSLAALSLLSLGYSCLDETGKQQPSPTPPALNFKSRKQHVKQMSDNPNYDVVVIGGGCNGVGVLLDASTRGLRTLLVEKDDFASGASSKSTKLIHGGVRYLQQAFELSSASLSSRKEKFNLVREAIEQRSLMIDSAPHLTTKIPFVIPCSNILTASYYYVGSMLYYLIYYSFAPKTKTTFNFPYLINRQEIKDIFPGLSPNYNHGVVYEDGSFNDARLLLSALLTATCGNGIQMPDRFQPANALNRTEFLDFIKDEKGTIKGVVVRDLISNKEYRINAKYVVNCTGAWADKIRLKDNPKAHKRICAVGGSHITYDNHVASSTFGLCAPSPDGRIILVVPWLNRVIAGTTETKFSEPTNNPVCSPSERSFINTTLLDIMSEIDPGKFMNLERTRWCGLRPLVVDDAESDTKKVSRSHVIEEFDSGLLSLMGGKWTTYRKMGEELVDKICQKEKQQGKDYGASQTKGLPLIGSASEKLKEKLFKEKNDLGVQLYNNFGSLATQIAKGKMERVFGSTTRAELQWIIKNELVTDIEDVLLRRTRLCFLVSKQQALSLASLIGEIMQKEWGWTNKQREERVAASIDKILSYEFD